MSQASKAGRWFLLWSRVVFALCLFGGWASAEVAVQPEKEAFQLQDLLWMSGTWGGDGLGGEIEEIWAKPAEDTMSGLFRLSAGGKTQVLEFLLITAEEDGIVFRFKHFGKDYEPWEKGDPLIFDLIHSKPGEAIFESSVQDNPKRLTYRLDGDQLTVTVEGMQNGEPDSFQMRMTRR